MHEAKRMNRLEHSAGDRKKHKQKEFQTNSQYSAEQIHRAENSLSGFHFQISTD
jgi:hypothetical protein